MQCIVCKEKMEKGIISSPGDVKVLWYSMEHPKLFGIMKGEDLEAWKCQKCGRIDLSTKVEK